MLIPFGTDRPLRRPTVVTYWLIGLNVAVFAGGAILRRLNPELFESLRSMLWLDPRGFHWWGLFSYQFLHAGFWHVFFNMLFLYVFGGNVEDKFGRLKFLLFYLIGGASAGGAHMLFEKAPVVGASGAIAAVTGAYMVLFPRTMVRVISLIIVIGTFHIPAWWLILAAIVKDLFMQGMGGGTGVAFAAHLGGYAFGITLSLALLAFKVVPREPFDLFSIGKQAYRRREFRELTSAGRSPWRSDAAGAAAEQARTGRNARLKAEREKRVAELRGEIARLLASERMGEAASAYLRLLEEDCEATLSRDAQAAVGNHLHASGQWHHAAAVYELFLKRYPRDREADAIRLLLAVINARYLNDPIKAKSLLSEVRGTAVGQVQRELVETLTRELA